MKKKTINIGYPMEYEDDDHVCHYGLFLRENEVKAVDEKLQELQRKDNIINELKESINNFDVFKEFTFPLMKRDEEQQVISSIDYEWRKSIKEPFLDKMKEQLKEIIEHYGVMKQLKYFQSEVFELNEAIIVYENKLPIFKLAENFLKKRNDGYESVNINHIAEEIADVWIMLTQFKEYYGISTEEIDKIIDYKVARQLERIKNENK